MRLKKARVIRAGMTGITQIDVHRTAFTRYLTG